MADKVSKIKTEVKRYRFVKDDDGHTYLIEADKRDTFQRWLDAGPYWKGYKGQDFNQFQCDSASLYTFENPKRGS